MVEGIPLEYLVAVGESDRTTGKGLTDGTADTSVVGTGWRCLTPNQVFSTHSGFSDCLKKKDIPIVTAATMVDLSDGTSIFLQVLVSLYLPNNKYTIVSSTQMRENGFLSFHKRPPFNRYWHTQ